MTCQQFTGGRHAYSSSYHLCELLNHIHQHSNVGPCDRVGTGSWQQWGPGWIRWPHRGSHLITQDLCWSTNGVLSRCTCTTSIKKPDLSQNDCKWLVAVERHLQIVSEWHVKLRCTYQHTLMPHTHAVVTIWLLCREVVISHWWISDSSYKVMSTLLAPMMIMLSSHIPLHQHRRLREIIILMLTFSQSKCISSSSRVSC